MPILKEKISGVFVYLFVGPLIFLWHLMDRSKLVYLLPFIFIAAVFINNLIHTYAKDGNKDRIITFKPQYFWAFVIYMFTALLSLLYPLYANLFEILPGNALRFDTVIRDILIMATPCLIFSANITYSHKHIVYLFAISVLSFFAIVGIDIHFTFLNDIYRPGGNHQEFHEGIVFGLFFLYFLRNKNFLLAIGALLFILLSHKRAIFLGLMPAIIIFWGLVYPTQMTKNRPALWVFMALYFIVFFFISINFDKFSGYILTEILGKSRFDAKAFLMARDVFIGDLNDYIYNHHFLRFLFGNGPGQADTYLQESVPSNWWWVNMTPVNPHNDFLKLQFDYGIVGILAFTFINIILYGRSEFGILCFLYTIPTMMVDNPLIFIYYLLYAGFISNTVISKAGKGELTLGQ